MTVEVIFDEKFFHNLKFNWLNTKEVFLLLGNIEDLIKEDLLHVTQGPPAKSESGEYYLTKKSYMDNWKTKNTKDSVSELKIEGSNCIVCVYSHFPAINLSRRLYYLKMRPEYIFIHYLSKQRDKNKEINPPETQRIDTMTSINFNHIKIVDFCPKQIQEDEYAAQIIIIIESYLNYQNLLMLQSQLKVKFGNKLVPCRIINSSAIKCEIPHNTASDVNLEILIGSNVVSFQAKEEKFRYVARDYFSKRRGDSFQSIDEYLIFSLSEMDMICNIKKLIKIIHSLLNFHMNFKSLDLDISSITNNFTQESLFNCLNMMIRASSDIKRSELIFMYDDKGYNIIHYSCAMDYDTILDLCSSNKFTLCDRSKDKLTPYEICAGMRNYKSLEKLVELIDGEDNEHIFNNNSSEKDRIFYNNDILKSALILALQNNKPFRPSDIKLLELLLKQIKIKFTVDYTSGSILDEISNCTSHIMAHNRYEGIKGAEIIQKYVRGWLRRNKYNGIKNAAHKLKDSKPKLFKLE